ncbi:PfkB family carbohydrate kinase [Nocardiopsis sp. RSe5-2]|uniref:PfkB family carbohydrate kinase n=1 Tax=Nocardiopsis endophytica TaxID=3018445 RepID=A0ABT4U4K5_9ACTN|nr:PfkB family carbohydrate kinase [Nocardiopsis endophytica]MDA2811891.1 PfkB family carbohydrate kinase [Nocardiopsis endophytica]
MRTRPLSDVAPDVAVLGEVLVEVSTDRPAGHGVPAVLGVSGDALNAAAAAARAGADTALAAVLPDDELGRAVADRVAELGVSTSLLRFRPGQQGMYLVHCDPGGERAFAYARRGSVGSTLGPGDLDEAALRGAGAVVASGIACAVSDSARRAVRSAAGWARRFVFDPNHRPRLASPGQAAAVLEEMARGAHLVTPSFPGEAQALLGADTPEEAARRTLAAGAAHAAVTCGERGAYLAGPDGEGWIGAVPAPRVVDQTGAGDVFAGTAAARIALGDGLEEAARLAVAAASLSVGGRGGTGLLPALEQTRAHARTAGGADRNDREDAR